MYALSHERPVYSIFSLNSDQKSMTVVPLQRRSPSVRTEKFVPWTIDVHHKMSVFVYHQGGNYCLLLLENGCITVSTGRTHSCLVWSNKSEPRVLWQLATYTNEYGIAQYLNLLEKSLDLISQSFNCPNHWFRAIRRRLEVVLSFPFPITESRSKERKGPLRESGKCSWYNEHCACFCWEYYTSYN